MKPQYCKGCRYSKDCNGYTQKDFGRCPEWVLNEARDKGVSVKEITHPSKS
jgi:hypothetical protein